jgi:hypothetical protein
VLDAIDLIDVHMLPFFSQQASTGSLHGAYSRAQSADVETAKKAWPIVLTDLNWFTNHGKGKKIYFSQVWCASHPWVGHLDT